jgi:hypothetical protein
LKFDSNPVYLWALDNFSDTFKENPQEIFDYLQNPINQRMNEIKRDIVNDNPSKDKILMYFEELRLSWLKKKIRDTEIYTFIGEVFNINPQFYMKSLYQPINLSFINELGKKIDRVEGLKKLRELEEYILKTYCLYGGEQFLGVFRGNLKLESEDHGEMVTGSHIFVTNFRIIAQGNLVLSYGPSRLSTLAESFFTNSDPEFKKKLRPSTYEEIPCYGYPIPLEILFGLKLKGEQRNLIFKNIMGYKNYQITIKIIRKKELDRICEILANEILLPLTIEIDTE